jgi:hypothetical protein
MLIALGIFVLLLVGVRLYAAWEAEADLAKAVAEADVSDPVWRWEDLEKQRAVITDEGNGATVVLAAAKQIPDSWLSPPETDIEATLRKKVIFDLLRTNEPVQLLGSELLTMFRDEVDPQKSALVAGRKLLQCPTGRFSVAWTKDVLTTPLPHLKECRKLINLFELAGALCANEGNASEATSYVEMTLNVGRAVGTEPQSSSQLARVACQHAAVRMVERILALNADVGDVTELGNDLMKEAQTDLVLLTARADRALWQRFCQAVYDGEISQSGPFFSATANELERWLYHRVWVRYGQGMSLRFMNEAVAIAKQPTDKQRDLWVEFDEKCWRFRATSTSSLEIRRALGYLMVPATIKVAEAQRKSQMYLTCAAVAIAAERFRLQEKRWPENLEELTPRFIPEVPRDYFRPAPISLRHVDDGLVIYSVGHDGKDHGGIIDRKGAAGYGSDIGFRLWNPDKRRQPPPAKAEEKKP